MGYSLPFQALADAPPPLVFRMVDAADGVTGMVGLTPTVLISKAGGAFAAPAGAVSEIGLGWYQVAGNVADLSARGPLILHATAPGADPRDEVYEVGLAALKANTAGQVEIDQTKDVPFRNQDSVAVPTIADCLQGGWSAAFAPEAVANASSVFIVYATNGITPMRTFHLGLDVDGKPILRS